jgi:hypothetical protein
MAEGGETSPHRKSYVETKWNWGDGLLTGFLKFVYDKHDIIVLSWTERRVRRRSRYEKVRLVEEGDITAKTCK